MDKFADNGLMPDDLHRFGARAMAMRWAAERENADARHKLLSIHERKYQVLSASEPVNRLGLDRDALRKVLEFVVGGLDVVGDE